MKETANRAFEEMRKAALKRLRIRDPREIAGLSGVTFDEKTASLRIPSLGRELCLSWPDCAFWPPVEGWQHLILLHYLDLADGTSLTGKWINFGSLREGVIRGRNRCGRVFRSWGRRKYREKEITVPGFLSFPDIPCW